MIFDKVLADVFDRGVERRFASEDEEREAILLAQQGDEAATVALIYAYAATLRAAVSSHYGAASGGAVRSHDGSVELEDARMAALVGLLDTIKAFDPARGARLAGRVSSRVFDALSELAASSDAVAVHPRILRRFYAVLRAADGDAETARELAPSCHLGRDTFDAVATALRGWESLTATDREGSEYGDEQAAYALWGGRDAFEEAEDRIMVEAAFAAIADDDFATDVVRLRYGFVGYRELTDGQVAEELGVSRLKAFRTRTAALVKMRDSFGLLEGEAAS